MESDFANRDYSDAVITCANNVADTIASVYGVNLDNGSYENGSTVQPGYQGGQSSGGSTLTDILTLVVGAVLLIVIIRSMAYVFASPCGWLWCFGGPRPPYRRWLPWPPASARRLWRHGRRLLRGWCRARRFRRRQLWRRLRRHGRWFQPRRRRWPWAVMKIKRERQWL